MAGIQCLMGHEAQVQKGPAFRYRKKQATEGEASLFQNAPNLTPSHDLTRVLLCKQHAVAGAALGAWTCRAFYSEKGAPRSNPFALPTRASVRRVATEGEASQTRTGTSAFVTGRDARVGRNESGCAELTGLEPAASGVTDRRSNQLSYNSVKGQSLECGLMVKSFLQSVFQIHKKGRLIVSGAKTSPGPKRGFKANNQIRRRRMRGNHSFDSLFLEKSTGLVFAL